MRNFLPVLTALMLSLEISSKLASAEPPIVFIHGFKGGKLAKPNGEVQWLTGSQGLGLTTASLGLPLQWGPQHQERDDLQPVGPLDRVVVIPRIWRYEVYGPWLDAARGWGASFYTFSYDWRRANQETSERFAHFLRDVHSKHPGKAPRIVAHSLGGLITLYTLNRHPGLASRVAFLAVPFQGNISFLPDLHIGVKIGLNAQILSWEVLTTYPSCYALFPEEGSRLLNEDGSPSLTRFHEVSEWQRQKLIHYGPERMAPGGFEAHLERALNLAREFRRGLVPASPASFVPTLIVTSKSRATFIRARRSSGAPSGWDIDAEPKVPGDGRVAHEDSLPPEGIHYQEFRTTFEHSTILNDPKVIERVREFIWTRRSSEDRS